MQSLNKVSKAQQVIDLDSVSIIGSFLDNGDKYDRVVNKFKELIKNKRIIRCSKCERLTKSYEYCGSCYERVCGECINNVNHHNFCNKECEKVAFKIEYAYGHL